jgi:2-polyprenyl-6-methoxyphenol hydroxylase-like FAD-dependent oxidoreductase
LIERLAAEGVRVERHTELLRFEQHEAGVRATLRRAGGSEETYSATYLAGCDGASSTVRETLGVGFPGGTYSGLFYVADIEGSGPTTDNQLHVDLEDADFLLVFPLKGQGRLRLVGRVRDAQVDQHDSLTFDEVRSRAMEHLRLNVTRVNWFSTYRVHHRVAQRFRDRRVFLLGDAAHIHSPVGGQGMNTGIGDAVNLAWKLAAVLKNDAPPTLLDTYEPERMPFAERLVATTDRAFTIVTAHGPVAQVVRTRVAPRMVPILFRIPAARQFMFKTLSQIVISYRNSPLSDGQAGRVHGGDRLPWVETSATSDNFAPLASLSWQVHVYGTASAELSATCADLGLPLHAFEWQSAMHRTGLEHHAAYLIRPDGYVALADREANPARLRRYLTSRGLRPPA